MSAHVGHISVTRTARYWTLGEPSATTRELWFVLHGYGQLAEYFIRNFEVLNDGTRVIVAPEGLSRFYVKDFTGRVGATWMTREDREHEIRDYVGYLDALYASVYTSVHTSVCASINESVHTAAPPLRVHVLAFSQGVATACRWLLAGTCRQIAPVERLYCWAGGLPADIDFSAFKPLFDAVAPVFVVGTSDEFITPAVIEQQRTAFEQVGIEFRLERFDGGHHIDKPVLKRLADD
jgi:predicted esterase